MALTVEDGTVVAGAECFENAATTAARLVALNLSDFDGKAESVQEAIIRRRTVECENLIRDGIEGETASAGQSRLFPRGRCYLTDGRLLDTDEIPEAIKAAVAHRCEDDAAGRISSSGRNLESDKVEGVTLVYSEITSKLASESPDAFLALSPLRWD